MTSIMLAAGCASPWRPRADYATAVAIPGFTRSFVTRVPALDVAQPRQVFTSVLFPLFPDAPTAAAQATKYDAVFPEAITFDDGFAKIVHATQLVGMEHLDEDGSGPPPVADRASSSAGTTKTSSSVRIARWAWSPMAPILPTRRAVSPAIASMSGPSERLTGPR